MAENKAIPVDYFSCEKPGQTIKKLEDENLKLKEEIKLLNGKLIEYTNIIKHIEFSVKLAVKEISNDIFLQK